MTRAVVCGAGGFIGRHLVKRLKREGQWVRGVDRVEPEDAPNIQADEYVVADLRDPATCRDVLIDDFDEVYNLAADMGGIGYLESAQCEILRNNALIDLNLIHAAVEVGVSRYFFSSSVCVYRDMRPGEPALTEDDAYPALPDNEYGWEKLYAERVGRVYGQKLGISVRLGRFENVYGPEGAWRGGREKAPAAICRKVAQARDGGTIEVWGDGSAVRSYIYVDDVIDAILLLMRSNCDEPVNVGNGEYVTVRQLVDVVVRQSGKEIDVRYVPGPVGVHARNFSNSRMQNLGWRPRCSLADGIAQTYAWIQDQVRRSEASLPVPPD